MLKQRILIINIGFITVKRIQSEPVIIVQLRQSKLAYVHKVA